MTLSGTINKTLILFIAYRISHGDLVDDFNGMNLLFQQLRGHCRFNLVCDCRFQTATFPI
jgi:hypothetical protein